jgi:cytochrome bd-type quinol oxidase subunit 2
MFELIIAISILLSLIIYALTGGADFGGGMWNLMAVGSRAARQRQAISEAIGPIWEANHVWLILVVVLLFSGFPRGFTVMMTALNIPVTAMLIGIVLRGSAFIFRKYDNQSDSAQRHWSVLFGSACLFAPFFQGVIIGALATGQIHVVDGRVALARMATIGQVTLVLAGWGMVQYPHLVMPDVTVNNAHASEITLRLLVLTLAVGAIILLPSLFFLFHLFKGKRHDLASNN